MKSASAHQIKPALLAEGPPFLTALLLWSWSVQPISLAPLGHTDRIVVFVFHISFVPLSTALSESRSWRASAIAGLTLQ